MILINRKNYKKMVYALCCAAILFISAAPAAPFLKKAFYLSPDSPEVTLNALIMEINQLEGYMIVAEERIELATYILNGNRITTQLMDIQGNTLSLSAFNAGERVLVRGYQLADDRIVAALIHKLPPKFSNQGIPLTPLK